MNTENRFNLIDEPWIPVVDVGRVSLKQIFNNSSYRALGGNPVQKIALTKLLLALAQAAYTPVDDDDWTTLKAEGMAQKCLDYMDKWHDHFWLYGERPFLQIPNAVLAAEQSFGAVVPEVATGNTPVLTETNVEKKLTDSDKALLIVTLMGFGLGGKKTDNSVVLSPKYKGKSKSGKPGASVGVKGFLHNFLLGESVLQTLWLNLFSQNQLKKISMYVDGLGVAPWQKMPENEDCETAYGLQRSLMGRLLPLSRFCLLGENGLHYSEGIAHSGYKEGIVDPSVAVNFSGKVPKVIWVDPERRPWRFLTALLSFISQSNTDSFDCMYIRHGLLRIGQLRQKQKIKDIGIWSGGLRVSSNAGEQYVSGNDDFVESSVMFPSELLGESWFEQLKYEMDELDKLSKIIYGTTLAFFKIQMMDGKEQAKIARNLFWQLCERKFQKLVNACGNIDEVKAMRKKLAQYVYKVYDTFCPKETARQLDAWAKCRPNLYKYLG